MIFIHFILLYFINQLLASCAGRVMTRPALFKLVKKSVLVT